jgi:hypothetical protein
MGFGQGTLLLVEGAAHRLAQSLNLRFKLPVGLG